VTFVKWFPVLPIIFVYCPNTKHRNAYEEIPQDR